VAEGPVSYLVMEYLEGEDLASLIERQGALPLAEAADVLLPAIAAIAAAHELGVIHRDLKPENIFLARTSFGGPCPKVVDFGISKVLGDPTAIALTATSAVFGTMFYLPPEQLGGSREADARGDQYALGTILYECVTGHRAFEGTSIYAVLKSVAEGVYPPARSWRPDLPARLETAIDRAMRLNPAARFASVRMLGAELLPHASPAVRAVWTPVFGQDSGRDACRGEIEKRDVDDVPVRIGTGTMLLRADDGTATFPPARDPVGVGAGVGDPDVDSDSDRDSDSEVGIEELRPPRSRLPRWAVAGVALGLAVAAVVSGVRRAGAPVEPGEAELPRVESPAPDPVVPALPRLPAPAPIPTTIEQPVVRSPRRDSPPAVHAPAIRRRKPRRVPPEAIDPAPEVRTNVPIPD